MRMIAASLMFMAYSLNAFGDGIGDAAGEVTSDKALAIQYLQISKFEQAINTAIDTYSLQLSGHISETERPQLKHYMHAVFGWDAIKDQLADLVVKLYTREELQAAITFEQSRLGSSITAKNEQFAKQFAELLSQSMQRFAQGNALRSNHSADSHLH
jgi:hypothetical protein